MRLAANAFVTSAILIGTSLSLTQACSGLEADRDQGQEVFEATLQAAQQCVGSLNWSW
jgi:hypothetical protein